MKEDKKRSILSLNQNMIVTTIIILFFVGVVFFYYEMLKAFCIKYNII